MQSLVRDGKCLLLAYDQGFEHGPTDFDERSVDPEYIVQIARESGVYTGVVFHEGVASKHYPIGGVEKENFPPLVVKLNGKTGFHKGEEPISLQLCTVERAIELGASGVGYTIYVGSEHEAEMMREFALIEDEAHKAGLVVIAWMYPRGRHIEEIQKQGETKAHEVTAYAARLGMELGADMVKVSYTGDIKSFEWVVKNAGKTGVLAQGGDKKDEDQFLKEMREVMEAGAMGLAVGRNIWQHEDSVGISKKLGDIVWPR